MFNTCSSEVLLFFSTDIRATADVDFWIRPDLENAKKVIRLLSEFGFPTDQLTAESFGSAIASEDGCGSDPNRIVHFFVRHRI